jgi:hypothetical protein
VLKTLFDITFDDKPISRACSAIFSKNVPKEPPQGTNLSLARTEKLDRNQNKKIFKIINLSIDMVCFSFSLIV